MGTHGGVEVAEGETLHASIAEAIQHTARGVPVGFAHFIEPRYAGVTCGTLRIRDAAQPGCGEEGAQRIVALISEMHTVGGP